jgi:PAS domain S-box-containing protein
MKPTSTVHDTFFRQLVERASDLIQDIALDRRITYVSPSCAAILTRTPEELLGQSCLSHIFEDDIIAFQQAMEDLIRNQRPMEIQYRYNIIGRNVSMA